MAMCFSPDFANQLISYDLIHHKIFKFTETSEKQIYEVIKTQTQYPWLEKKWFTELHCADHQLCVTKHQTNLDIFVM